jgi:hypothetical protein
MDIVACVLIDEVLEDHMDSVPTRRAGEVVTWSDEA